jgi:hypothetical protein
MRSAAGAQANDTGGQEFHRRAAAQGCVSTDHTHAEPGAGRPVKLSAGKCCLVVFPAEGARELCELSGRADASNPRNPGFNGGAGGLAPGLSRENGAGHRRIGHRRSRSSPELSANKQARPQTHRNHPIQLISPIHTPSNTPHLTQNRTDGRERDHMSSNFYFFAFFCNLLFTTKTGLLVLVYSDLWIGRPIQSLV